MNKILKVLALGAMALSTTACSDFLEVNPRTQVSETEFYKTEDDMMKGLYAVMNEMQTRMPEVWSYSSLLGDESETGGGIGEGSYKTKWDTFTYDATSCFGAWGYGSWWNEWDFGLFNGVIAANLLIDKLAGCNLSADFVNSISAEARFYRAIFYYHLFMGYEQFPLIKHYLAASEMYSVAKGTREEIYEFMMGDLDDEVTKYLPQRSATQQGRVCRDAAKLLRAKIILFHRDETKYQVALNDMKEIITSGRYRLNPDYQNLWVKDGEWCVRYVMPAITPVKGLVLHVLWVVVTLLTREVPSRAAWAKVMGRIPCRVLFTTCLRKVIRAVREQSLSMRTRLKKWQKWWPKVNCRQEVLSKSVTSRKITKAWGTIRFIRERRRRLR